MLHNEPPDSDGSFAVHRLGDALARPLTRLGSVRESSNQRVPSPWLLYRCIVPLLNIYLGVQLNMRTVIETPTFQKQAAEIWHEEERHAFIDWIAENPDSGDVIPGADGARKVRWARKGMGKRGGARVIYFHLVDDEVVLLVMVYAKAERENVMPKEIKRRKA